MGIISFFSSFVSRPDKKPKRSRTLEMESLEDRLVPSTLTLAPITLSSSDGQTGGAAASGPIAQFNPSLGQLQSVTIAQQGSIATDIQIENISTTTAANIQVSINGTMSLSGGGVNQAVSLTPDPSVYNFAATTFDGKLDYSGTSGSTVTETMNSTNGPLVLSSSNALLPFEGTGTVSLSESSTASFSLTSDVANVANNITSTATDVVTVTYTYIPNNAGISGTVYLDANDDGTLGSGDTGISGVGLTLTGTTTQGVAVSQTTTTGTGGTYSFQNLAAGTYQVTQTPPTGYLMGKDKDMVGSLGGTAGSSQVSSIVVSQGQMGTSYNFGELLPSSLAGTIYLDSNDNGVLDSGEAGISGVSLTLSGTNDLGVAVSQTASTGSGGTYSFQNLRPGTYSITETPPTGYLSGMDKDMVGSLGGTAGSSQVTSIAVGQNQAGTAYNYGELLPSSLAGTVYLDSNDNGVLDNGETGISGVSLTLTGTNDLGVAVSQTASTGSGGTYSFQNLRPGTYSIAETPPTGYLAGLDKDMVGTLGGSAGTNQVTTISVGQNQAGKSYNYGELLPGTLSGFAYFDANADGVMDTGDTGIGGVTITLTGTNDSGVVIDPATTASDGSYAFTNLRPGTYVITESPPSGYLPGSDNLGSLGGSVGTNQFTAVVVISGASGIKYNFGELADTDDLSIVKTASASSVIVGSQLVYTLVVDNVGATTAQGVTVTDPLPSGTTYVSAQGPPGWNVTDSTDAATGITTVTATAPTLPVGSAPSFTITILAPNVAGSITNTATVSSVTPDSNPNNNQSSVTTLVTDIPGGPVKQDIQPLFGPIPIFTKTQLVGASLNSTASADAAFVVSAYLTFTGTSPSATTVATDVFEMELGKLTQAQLVSQLYFSGQFIGQEISNMYQSILGTAPTASQLSAAAAQLQAGVSLTTLEANLLTSSAYLQAHTSPDSLVIGLDQSILGSTPSISSMNLQVQSLGATTWTTYVQSQVTSSQALTIIIQEDYEGILGRAPSSAELNAWISAFQNNQATPDGMLQYLFSSAEFMQRALANS